MITCYIGNKTVKKIEFSKIKQLKKHTCWMDFENAKHEDLKSLEKLFGIHHLVIEDCLAPQEKRSKITEYKNYLHLVIFAVSKRHPAKLSPIHFILNQNFVISIHKFKLPEFESLKQNKEDLQQAMTGTADKLLHVLLDRIVDDYFPMLDELNDELDVLEDKIIENPQAKYLKKLFALKRNTLRVRKKMGPQRDVIALLTKGSYKLITEKSTVYFRDLYDHTIWINDQLDNIRDIISSVLEIHLSVLSNKMNEVMKVLTIFATIMLPLTVIGSIYGMNFKYMPELQWRYGYFGVWLVMIAIVVVMVSWFRKKGWL